MHFDFFIPTKIIFGRGRLKSLANQKKIGKKALIVTTNGQSMYNLGYLQKIKNLLQQSKIQSAVYDEVLPNPLLENVMQGAEKARNCGCDMVLGLGSDSAIEVAKAIALMVKNNGSYWDYAQGKKEPSQKSLPIIAVPTAIGRGAEVSPWAEITNPEKSEKISLARNDFFPQMAIIDCNLMSSIPKKITAYQGMEVFFNVVESYMSCVAHPISNLWALEAITNICEYLPQAVKNGNDLQAREKLAWASVLGGAISAIAECRYKNSMEYALASFYPDLPKGAGMVALAIPYFSYLIRKEPQLRIRYIKMAQAMGEKGVGPQMFIRGLKKLINNAGLDKLQLSTWEVDTKQARDLAVNSLSKAKVWDDFDDLFAAKNNSDTILTQANHCANSDSGCRLQ